MLVKLSSKGQLVIPKSIRQTLSLEPGTQLHVELEDRRIILEPVLPAAIDELYGKYAGADLLEELEAEHRQEMDLE